MNYDPKDGPQVFSRPGTKRWQQQVIKRIGYLNIKLVYAKAEAKRQAQREQEMLNSLLGEIELEILKNIPAQGNA